jgi:Tfp pilus assembly protein PilF
MTARFSLGALALALALGLAAPAGATPGSAQTPGSAAQILLQRGQKAMDAKDFKGAVADFERALVADPANAKTYTLLGLAHRGLGEQARARKYLRTALDIDPNDVDALQAQGQIYAQAGDVAKAQSNFDKLAKLCGECVQAKALGGEIAKAKATQPNAQAQGNPATPKKDDTPGG